MFRSAELFAHTEGIVPAPESAHAVAAVVKKAAALREEGRTATILFSLSGHGLFDLAAYEAYLDGTLPDQGDPSEAIASALRALPEVRP